MWESWTPLQVSPLGLHTDFSLLTLGTHPITSQSLLFNRNYQLIYITCYYRNRNILTACSMYTFFHREQNKHRREIITENYWHFLESELLSGRKFVHLGHGTFGSLMPWMTMGKADVSYYLNEFDCDFTFPRHDFMYDAC